MLSVCQLFFLDSKFHSQFHDFFYETQINSYYRFWTNVIQNIQSIFRLNFFKNKTRIIVFSTNFSFFLTMMKKYVMAADSWAFSVHLNSPGPDGSINFLHCRRVFICLYKVYLQFQEWKSWKIMTNSVRSLFVSRRLYFLVFGQTINQLGWFPAPRGTRGLPDQALTLSRRRQHLQSLRLISFHRGFQDQTTFWHLNRKLPSIQGHWYHSIARHLMNK